MLACRGGLQGQRPVFRRRRGDVDDIDLRIGQQCLGIWADEGGVLLILQRTGPNTVRFHPLNTAGLPADSATLSSFRWERVRKFIDPNSTVDGGSR